MNILFCIAFMVALIGCGCCIIALADIVALAHKDKRRKEFEEWSRRLP